MMNPAARQPKNVPNEVQWLVLAHAAHVCAAQRHLQYVQVEKLRSKKFRGPVACQDWTPRFKLFRRWLSRQGRWLQHYRGIGQPKLPAPKGVPHQYHMHHRSGLLGKARMGCILCQHCGGG